MCSSYIPLLAVLVTSDQKDDQGLSSLHKVHSITQSAVNTHLFPNTCKFVTRRVPAFRSRPGAR